MTASHALSQLSYTPIGEGYYNRWRLRNCKHFFENAGNKFELAKPARRHVGTRLGKRSRLAENPDIGFGGVKRGKGSAPAFPLHEQNVRIFRMFHCIFYRYQHIFGVSENAIPLHSRGVRALWDEGKQRAAALKPHPAHRSLRANAARYQSVLPFSNVTPKICPCGIKIADESRLCENLRGCEEKCACGADNSASSSACCRCIKSTFW